MRALVWMGFAAALLTSLAAAAQDANVTERRNYQLENDAWGRRGSDRDYTMGLLLTDFSLAGERSLLWLRPLGVFNAALGLTAAVKPDTLVHWTLGGESYTPNDLLRADPIRGDRPYASLLYLGAGYWSSDGDLSTESQFQLALLGTPIGKTVQRGIHHVCCKNHLPEGWENQVGQGGSPALLYHLKWNRQLDLLSSDRAALVLGAGADLGYQVRAIASATAYVGATAEDLRAIQAQSDGAAPPVIKPGGQAAAMKLAGGKGAALWLDYEVSAVGYNQLLQGAWFGRNALTYTYGEIAHTVHRGTIGADLTFLPRWLFGYCESHCRLYATQTWRSRELRDGDERWHRWGGFILSTDL